MLRGPTSWPPSLIRDAPCHHPVCSAAGQRPGQRACNSLHQPSLSGAYKGYFRAAAASSAAAATAAAVAAAVAAIAVPAAAVPVPAAAVAEPAAAEPAAAAARRAMRGKSMRSGSLPLQLASEGRAIGMGMLG
jgi:hypothetical protein